MNFFSSLPASVATEPDLSSDRQCPAVKEAFDRRDNSPGALC